MQLAAFKALTFDCYGTLIDWETGMIEALRPLTERVGTALTRNDILQAHARQESKQQDYTPTKKYSEYLCRLPVDKATLYKQFCTVHRQAYG